MGRFAAFSSILVVEFVTQAQKLAVGIGVRPFAKAGALIPVHGVFLVAFLAVQDLCLLANGEPALWLPGSGPVSIPFAFEVINRTLVSHQRLFTALPPFRYLLRERACALVLKNARKPSLEWPTALRLSDLSATLLSKYAATLRTES